MSAEFINGFLCLFSLERPLEEPGWSRLQLTVVILVPCCLLCVGILLGVCAVQGHRCAYSRTHKQDPEEPLDDQMLMSPDKCLKDLIYDMSTSGSGSGTRKAQQLFPTSVEKSHLFNCKCCWPCRASSPGPENHSSNHRPTGDHRERPLWGGVAREVAWRGCSGKDLFLQGWEVLVPWSWDLPDYHAQAWKHPGIHCCW